MLFLASLNSLKTRVGFTNYIQSPFALHYLTVRMSLFGRSQRVKHFLLNPNETTKTLSKAGNIAFWCHRSKFTCIKRMRFGGNVNRHIRIRHTVQFNLAICLMVEPILKYSSTLMSWNTTVRYSGWIFGFICLHQCYNITIRYILIWIISTESPCPKVMWRHSLSSNGRHVIAHLSYKTYDNTMLFILLLGV